MKDREIYSQWLESMPKNSDEYQQLINLSEQEIKENFHKDIHFGTGGIRELMGLGSNRLNVFTVRKVAKGYSNYLIEKFHHDIKVCIAYDNRNNSYQFAMEMAKVLSSNNIKCYIFDSLRPTPELSFALRYLNCSGGIVITASHNPKEYNGIKIYDEYGCQCVPRDTDVIADHIKAVKNIFEIVTDVSNHTISSITQEVDEAYYRALEGIQEYPEMIKNIKIVYSPLHGTGFIPVTHMLTKLGYDLEVVAEQCNPDVNFSNTESINPENQKSFIKAVALAKQVKADLVMNTDPDCDRIGLVVLHNGEYRYLTGNQTGAIFLYYLLNEKKKKNTLPDDAVVYNTIVTSDLGTRICADFGVKVISTLTGFKFIGDKIRELEDESTFLFGYEESYGYLIKDICRDKDGVQAAILSAEICNFYKSKKKTLIDVLEEIYKKYGYVEDIQENETLLGLKGEKLIHKKINEFRKGDIKQLEGRNVVAKEDYLYSIRYEGSKKTKLKLPKSNVIKFILDDGSWVVVRPSGNEPKIKYYKNLWCNPKMEDK